MVRVHPDRPSQNEVLAQGRARSPSRLHVRIKRGTLEHDSKSRPTSPAGGNNRVRYNLDAKPSHDGEATGTLQAKSQNDMGSARNRTHET